MDNSFTPEDFDMVSETDARLFAVWTARQMQHLLNDKRSIEAIDVAERFAYGRATRAELNDAEIAADTARTVEKSAHWFAARSAEEAACWSAADSAWSAAVGAAFAATNSAADALVLASEIDRIEARKDVFLKHQEMYNHMLNGTAPWQEGGK